MKKYLRDIHLWSGLTLGLLLSVLSLSGLVLVYQSTLLGIWYPQLATQGQPTDVKTAQVLSMASRESQQKDNSGKLAMIQLPRSSEPHYQIKWQDAQGQRFDYIDANSLQKVLTRNSQSDWLLWLFQLHSHLLGGDVGEQILGVLTIGIVALIITGVWVWWPGKRRLKQNLSPPKTTHTSAWLLWYHRFSGGVFSPLLLIAVLSGLAMVYFKPVKAALVAIADQQVLAPVTYTMKCPVDAPKVSWQQQLAQVHSRFPDADIIRIYPSDSATKPNRFRLKFAAEWHQNGRTYVYLNPCNNEVVYAHDARQDLLGARWANMIYPIHSVHVGGVIYKSLMTLTALTPPLLFISGLITWKRRTFRRKPQNKR